MSGSYTVTGARVCSHGVAEGAGDVLPRAPFIPSCERVERRSFTQAAVAHAWLSERKPNVLIDRPERT
eukprot:3326478-Prymnesium_polylepis.2